MGKNENMPSVEAVIMKPYEVVEMDISTERTKEGNVDKIETCSALFYRW